MSRLSLARSCGPPVARPRRLRPGSGRHAPAHPRPRQRLDRGTVRRGHRCRVAGWVSAGRCCSRADRRQTSSTLPAGRACRWAARPRWRTRSASSALPTRSMWRSRSSAGSRSGRWMAPSCAMTPPPTWCVARCRGRGTVRDTSTPSCVRPRAPTAAAIAIRPSWWSSTAPRSIPWRSSPRSTSPRWRARRVNDSSGGCSVAWIGGASTPMEPCGLPGSTTTGWTSVSPTARPRRASRCPTACSR